MLINGVRFFFYSNENEEPAHVHVAKGDANGKIWLEPKITVAFLHGFTSSEENAIMWVVTDNYIRFETKWHEYFDK